MELSVVLTCLNQEKVLGGSVETIKDILNKNKIKYVFNFYNFLYKLRGQYDSVFVHMNQEYVLLGGLYWKSLNIPVYFWRNHPQGNLLTKISILLSKKVFCTSNKSDERK